MAKWRMVARQSLSWGRAIGQGVYWGHRRHCFAGTGGIHLGSFFNFAHGVMASDLRYAFRTGLTHQDMGYPRCISSHTTWEKLDSVKGGSVVILAAFLDSAIARPCTVSRAVLVWGSGKRRMVGLSVR